METQDAPTPEVDTHTLPDDTPTHRLHLMQMKMNDVAAFIAKLQTRRATIVEKIKKTKANSGIAREIQVNKSFKRLMSRIDSKLESAQSDLDDAADILNQARALFLEASDGEVLLTKEIKSDGTT